MKRKILFTDLDGTLLNTEKIITDRNQSAIEKALEQGHYVTITTGRPLPSAIKVAEKLGLDREGCYVIAYNGGEIYDAGAKKSIRDIRLDMEYVTYLFHEAISDGLYIQTYQEQKIFAPFDSAELQHYHRESGMSYEIFDNVPGALTESPHKVLLANLKNQEVLRTFREKHFLWEQGKCLSFFSAAPYLEYCPIGATKGDSVHFLAEYLNIPLEDTVAVGDERNDITMIREAAVGVAMKNAHPEVLEIADYITENDCDHDGIAEVIEKFILM